MKLALVGGTGTLNLFKVGEERSLETGYGEASAPAVRVGIGALDAWYLARHGRPHRIPPHRINYRANIDGLKQLGVEGIVAINAVGGVDPALPCGGLVIPDQLIDYTWGRVHSFSDEADSPLRHVEFAQPFGGRLRTALLAAADAADLGVIDAGCVAVTQGPRLETAAEIRRLQRDGCTVVGMTSMPEAALAREAGMDYASLCVVANPAAGLDPEPISMEDIERVLAGAMDDAVRLLACLGKP